jgi:hypothetical protein
MVYAESFPGFDKVIEQNENFAAELAGRKAMQAANFLIRYVGEDKPLPREAYRAILAQERSDEKARYLAKREAGLANDKHSTSSGITALVREGLEPFFTNPEDREIYGQLLDMEEVGEVGGQSLYALRMKLGFFEDTAVGIRFSVKGHAGLNGVSGAMEDSFMLYRDSVVTIVGNEGDFWQNPFLNPDGTRTDAHLEEAERLEAVEAAAGPGGHGNI